MKFKYPKNFNLLSNEIQETWEQVKDYLYDLQTDFNIKSVTNPVISRFELFINKLNPTYFKSWFVTYEKFGFILCLVEYDFQYQSVGLYGASTTSERNKYFFGYLNSKMDLGKTIIRPESISDKVFELFNPIEVDFKENKKFSDKYYVLTNNREKLKSNITLELMDYLSTVSNLQLEFSGNKCMFRLPKSIDKSELHKLCLIGMRLDKILNKN